MASKQSVAQHCKNNTLYIPMALYGMRDIKPLLHNGKSVIFFKDLEQDLVNIEFHTNEPCLIYIEAGAEIITTCHDEVFEVRQNEAIFLPKGLNLYSDYSATAGCLNAYLLFFSDDVVTEFLATGINAACRQPAENTIHKLNTTPALAAFFASLHSMYEASNNSPHILKLKLLELLHLIDIQDSQNLLRSSLSAVQRGSSKRNIKRLMEQYAISDLSCKDFAALSGRSISGFNQEFKKLYAVTPKQWLIEQRLAHAHRLLTEQHWSVTATASAAGYDNISHFIAAFKRRYQQTPRQIKSIE